MQREMEKGTLVHYITSCTSEWQHFFKKNPFLKSTEHRSPSAGGNVCWMHIIHSEGAPPCPHNSQRQCKHLPPLCSTPQAVHTDRQKNQWEWSSPLEITALQHWLTFFPSSPCVCVLFFNWSNEPMLCCRQEKGGEIAATAKGTSSLLSASLKHC